MLATSSATSLEELIKRNQQLMHANSQLIAEVHLLNQYNEQLQRSETRYRSMVDSVRDYAIFMLDSSGHIATWNDGARRFKGYEAHEILGQHFSRFYLPEDIAVGKPASELKIAIEKGVYEEEGWRIRKDGSRFWANVVITRVTDSSGILFGFTKVTRDLTERMLNEEKLREAYDQLERRVMERTTELQTALSARDEFLSIASHELKTPLTSLKLQVQMNLHRLETKKAGLNYDSLHASYKIELKQISILSGLIEDLLDISRIQAGRLELSTQKISLSKVVQETMSPLSDLLKLADCQVRTKFEDDILGHWDRPRLEQVVINLLTNIIKYAPGSKVEVIARKLGERAQLIISDNGSGIPKNKQDLIFERVERSHHERSIGGLGLGLYIVKKIVKAHHGTVTVESDVGKGTRFTIELPIGSSDNERARE